MLKLLCGCFIFCISSSAFSHDRCPKSEVIEITEKCRIAHKSIKGAQFSIWIIDTAYEVFLDDLTYYKINIVARTFNDEKVSELFAKQWLNAGDEIKWSDFHAIKIVRDGKEIDLNGLNACVQFFASPKP